MTSLLLHVSRYPFGFDVRPGFDEFHVGALCDGVEGEAQGALAGGHADQFQDAVGNGLRVHVEGGHFAEKSLAEGIELFGCQWIVLLGDGRFVAMNARFGAGVHFGGVNAGLYRYVVDAKLLQLVLQTLGNAFYTEFRG